MPQQSAVLSRLRAAGELLVVEHLWRSEYIGDERAGDIHVSNLRRKIGAGTIETVRGEGYRLRLIS